MQRFKQFGKELFATWWARLFVLLAAGSTIATYIASFVPGFVVPRWVLVVISLVAWLLAPFDLYCRQRKQIERLDQLSKKKLIAQLSPHDPLEILRATVGHAHTSEALTILEIVKQNPEQYIEVLLKGNEARFAPLLPVLEKNGFIQNTEFSTHNGTVYELAGLGESVLLADRSSIP